MAYTVTIHKVETIISNYYEQVLDQETGQGRDLVRHYKTVEKTCRDTTREQIYQQTVAELDVVAVIDAVNGTG